MGLALTVEPKKSTCLATLSKFPIGAASLKALFFTSRAKGRTWPQEGCLETVFGPEMGRAPDLGALRDPQGHVRFADRAVLSSCFDEIEAIVVHHLAPRRHEVFRELLLHVCAAIDFGKRPQLRV